MLARRSLLRIPRQPDLLMGFTVQPVMFVLLFVYVFGGAIETPGFDYVDFLMPGIIVQSIAFGGFVTALGLAEDLKKGLIDRFRSLPMSRAAVLTGRTLADVVTNLFQLAVMIAVGLRGRLPLLDGRSGGARWGRAAPAPRVRVLVGVRLHRSRVLVPGGVQRLRVHRHPAHHVRLVGVRSRRLDAGLAPGLRRGEPGHDHGRRHTRPLHRHAGRQRRLGAVAWGLGITAVFPVLSVWRYRRAVTR